MNHNYIDLYTTSFWLFVFVSLVVLTPITNSVYRKWVWTAINVWFLYELLGAKSLVVFVGALFVWGLLLLISRGNSRWLCSALIISGALVLFVFHQLPDMSEAVGLERLNPIMTLIGFSYVVLRMYDLLRAVAEKRHASPDVLSIINYLIPFHMLVAGPIQSYDDFVAQPAVPNAPNLRECLIAAERISFGMFKKFVLANTLSAIFLTGFTTSGVHYLIEVQVFFLWLYLAFSGYCDIAVGIGKLLGIATPENFNRPYFSRNMIDFWERWHITLGQFIRRNIMCPLESTMQRSNPKVDPLVFTSICFVIAFLLCGLWHEISWRFFVWGGLNALGLVSCNLYRHFLQKTLGNTGMRRYMKNGFVHVIAVLITYEYVAFSLALIARR